MAAGRTTGQHILPQLLLKGFKSRSRKREYYAFQMRRDGIHEANIKKIGKQRLFYGEDAANEIESTMSRLEGVYAVAASAIRESGTLTLETLAVALSMIANLATRTDYFRAGIADEGREFIDYMAQRFTGASGANLISDFMRRNPGLIESRVLAALGASPLKEVLDQLPPSEADNARNMVLAALRQQTPKQFTAKHLAPLVDPFFAQLTSGLDWAAIVGAGHQKALAETPVADGYVKQFETMRWSTMQATEHTFAIGDCGPLARRLDDEYWSTLVVLGPKAQTVLLPISDALAIIGCCDGVESIQVNVDHLFEDTVRLSRDFVVASRSSEREQRALPWIGSRAKLLEADFASETIARAFDSVLGREDGIAS